MIELNLYTVAFVPSAVDLPFAASVSKVPSVPAVIVIHLASPAAAEFIDPVLGLKPALNWGIPL